MRKTSILGLAACLAFAAGAAMAQTPGAAPGATAPSGPPSIDWTMAQLLADPEAKAVIDKYLPGVEADPRLSSVANQSLRAVAGYPQAHIDAGKLAAIQADLAALPPQPKS